MWPFLSEEAGLFLWRRWRSHPGALFFRRLPGIFRFIFLRLLFKEAGHKKLFAQSFPGYFKRHNFIQRAAAKFRQA